MLRSRWSAAAIGIVLAAVFIRLGVWQVDRLHERRAANRTREARLSLPPLDLDESRSASGLPSVDSVAWRRVRVTGRWDPDHEVVVRGRFWMDTPGVEVLTPLRLRDGSAVLVMRGWMPAADGVSADLPAARVRADTAVATGLALPGESPAAVPPRRMRFSDGERLVLGTVDLDAAAGALPYRVAPFYLRVLPRTDAPRGPEREARAGRAASVPVPLPAPELTNGPHLSYAIQWFGFAALALAGAFLLPRARAGRGTGPRPETGRPEIEETRR